jgi:hypothetical protein
MVVTARFFGRPRSFLDSPGVAFRAGKIGVGGVDMHEIESIGIDLVERLAASLRHDQMT